LKIGLIGSSVTSVNNYQLDYFTLEDGADRLFRNVDKELPLYSANIPGECSSHLLRGGSLKPHLHNFIPLITYCKLYSRSSSTCSFIQVPHNSSLLQNSNFFPCYSILEHVQPLYFLYVYCRTVVSSKTQSFQKWLRLLCHLILF
jgi:hypothetical protein